MKIRLVKIFLVAACLAPCVVLLAAQTPITLQGSPSGASTPSEDLTFRSFSRIVVVDVVVKDSFGRPVKGLTADDFEVLEDGAAQKIQTFSTSTTEQPKLGIQVNPQWEDIFSNGRTGLEGDGATPSVILLDFLNTSFQDRGPARQALQKFLEQRMRRGDPIAIFVLSNKLELVQDFTTNEGLLRSASEKAMRTPASPKDRPAAGETAAILASYDGGQTGAILAQLAAELTKIEKEAENQRTAVRVEHTLDSLRAVARYAARHRGRKSLVWLSSAFPFAIQTNLGLENFEVQLRQTSNLLSSAQIAVYPVDVRGMKEVKARELEEPTLPGILRDPGKLAGQYQEKTFDFYQSQDSMKEIAELTGGMAYINRNDLDVAIASALDDNRESYTLGYYPIKKTFDNRFRRIKVRLKNRSVAELRHRRGYYASGFTVERSTVPDLLRALENDVIVSAQIPILSRLQPTAPSAGVPFKVELFVKGGNIHYTDVSNTSAAFLDFAVVAMAPNGKPVARTWHRGELKMDEARTQKAEQTGLLYSLPMTLPSGMYKVRAGVRDSFTGRIGSVEIPVVVK